jgi:sirohydrochlorin cobaltochelatase
MPDSIEATLASALSDSTFVGQILIQRTAGTGFALCHRDDRPNARLEIFRKPQDAIEIARYDDDGDYRPLKTAPNLRHGWRLELINISELQCAIDYFYPGRLATLARWKANRLTMTTLRETLNRQSGMYRVAAKISDEQIDEVVGRFCKSNGGCLRTILWKRDEIGVGPSRRLPPEKFDPTCDQAGRSEHPISLLCPEACNLLVAECRKVVKGESNAT